MLNIETLESSAENATPAQPPANKQLTKDGKTLAEVYKLVFQLKFNKLIKGDKEEVNGFINQGKTSRFASEFIKEVIKEAEEIFDKSSHSPLDKKGN